jgi:hypothetical protein
MRTKGSRATIIVDVEVFPSTPNRKGFESRMPYPLLALAEFQASDHHDSPVDLLLFSGRAKNVALASRAGSSLIAAARHHDRWLVQCLCTGIEGTPEAYRSRR